MKDTTLEKILAEINRQTGVDYGFQSNGKVDKNRRFTIDVKEVSVEEALTILLKDSPYDFVLEKNRVVIIERKVVAKTVNLIDVSGRVTDEKGNPIPGATVIIYGTTQGVASDAEGRYSIRMKPDDVLSVSFIGYKTEVIPIKGKTRVNIQLNPTAENIEEVTVVAFGTQKKESVVSAISTVRAMDLKSSNSDLTSSFAGRIPGIIGWQTGGLPVALTEEEMNTKFYIRGITSFQTGANIDPLILIDGVESSKLDLSRMAPEDIESFSVLKDASATAMYGARGANGVLLITTKKGEEGSVYATARYEAIFSMPTREIDVVDPIAWMRMYNQAGLGRNQLLTPKYSVEYINRTASGKYPSFVYPQNNWYKMMFKDFNVNHHAGFSIRGGAKVVQYYASVNYNRDQGMLKSDRLNDFSSNIENDQVSFRANLNINLKAGIKLLINSSTTLDKYHGPLADVTQAYYMAFKASPVDFAATYPGDETYNWPHIRFGGVDINSLNPYKELQKGYIDRTRYSTTNKAEYIHNLASLVKGLELRASVAISQQGYYSANFSTEPYMYALGDYSFETGKHKLSPLNALYARRTLDVIGRNAETNTQVTYTGTLIHTAGWGNHQTAVTAVLQAQEQTYTPVETVLEGQPRRNLTFSMRGSYGFKDRYFIEGSFGYNGSERFAKKNRMGFFPAGGIAWVVSSEPFMGSISNVVSYMKFRASYGRVGNDGIISKPRFVFIPTIGGENVADPEPFTTTLSRFKIESYANNDIRWEIAEQVNLGLESKLFGGIFEFTLDAFQEVRHNILSYRTVIPASMGLEEIPLDNVGKARTRGMEFSGKIQHAFSNDTWIILNGTLTYSQSKYLELEEATDKPKWQRRVGNEISQQVGYIAEGLFRDEAEIANSPRQGGDVMPGDIRYRDLNNDGVIDVEDATYIGFPETPRLIYGFQGFINYKNWEFNFAFQGSGKRGFFINPQQISPFVENNAMLKAIYDDHWTEDNMQNKPFWPRLSTHNVIDHNPQEDWYNKNNAEIRKSTYFMRECAFLRCTSLELAYNMPRALVDRWKLQGLKFFVRANNPFMISNFDLWDVELGENGFNYPIQKTYSIGLNLSF
ncbi:SusC/RagA family TonB-linked outer membrane protein [Butyricimonas sp.]|uniref:SusC/RagA family TonB-linked outer membrane protein n=1 Tax=Butyricimonas sp. TaxID=1969738 RepID=UPI0025B81062|nr:SusC/RagA family TonB-linked outer membrane protein [Butyricimonas sp.]